MCRKGGRRCPNSTHGRYNKSKASVKSYKVASERLQEQIVKAHTLTNLKAEQAAIKSSGDAAKLEAHIAEHGSQQALSKKLGNTRTSIANKEKRLLEHYMRTDPATDRLELESVYDEKGTHIETGISVLPYTGGAFTFESEDSRAVLEEDFDAGRPEGSEGRSIPDVVRNISPDDHEAAAWARKQDGGVEALMRYRPELITSEDLDHRVAAFSHEYVNNPDEFYDWDDEALARSRENLWGIADATLANKLARGHFSPSEVLDYASNRDIAAAPETARFFSRHKDKSVRMAYAQNEGAAVDRLARMSQTDRSKHIREQAHQTLVKTQGKEKAESAIAALYTLR